MSIEEMVSEKIIDNDNFETLEHRKVVLVSSFGLGASENIFQNVLRISTLEVLFTKQLEQYYVTDLNIDNILEQKHRMKCSDKIDLEGSDGKKSSTKYS